MESRFLPEPDRGKPGVPEGERPPRKADALRGSIARLSAANAERHDVGDAERTQTRAEMRYERRRRLLTRLIARWTPYTLADVDRLLASPPPGGITAAFLRDHIASRQKLDCASCKYNLRGLPPTGHCPECGARYSNGEITPGAAVHLIASAFERPAAQITPEFCIRTALIAEWNSG